MTMTYLTRSDWEEPGYRIADHTNSPPVDWSMVTNVTIHYPGGGTYPAGDRVWAANYVRSMQRSYVNSRGYSLGYNEVVTQSGIVVEARGAGTRCAANGTTEANVTSYAIQIAATGLGDDADPASPAAIAAVRERVAWAQRQAGRKLAITGHRQHKATSCPGEAIYRQVLNGVFDVPYPTDPTPPPSEDDMGMNVTRIRFAGYQEQLVCFRASVDTLRTLGVIDDPLIVLPDPNPTQKAEIEVGLGHPLTPIKGD